MRVTIACPEWLIPDANQLARCLGYSADDGLTYGLPIWQDTLGNRYAVASGVVSDAFHETAASPLSEPEWGADMDAAARAQAAIAIGVSAGPMRISAVFGDVVDALVTLGVTRHDPDLQE